MIRGCSWTDLSLIVLAIARQRPTPAIRVGRPLSCWQRRCCAGRPSWNIAFRLAAPRTHGSSKYLLRRLWLLSGNKVISLILALALLASVLIEVRVSTCSGNAFPRVRPFGAVLPGWTLLRPERGSSTARRLESFERAPLSSVYIRRGACGSGRRLHLRCRIPNAPSSTDIDCCSPPSECSTLQLGVLHAMPDEWGVWSHSDSARLQRNLQERAPCR